MTRSSGGVGDGAGDAATAGAPHFLGPTEGRRAPGCAFAGTEPGRVLLVSIAVVNVVYIIYSWMIPPAYLSGRFVWPLYTVLVPLAAVSIQSTWASVRLERLAEKAFGRLADD